MAWTSSMTSASVACLAPRWTPPSIRARGNRNARPARWPGLPRPAASRPPRRPGCWSAHLRTRSPDPAPAPTRRSRRCATDRPRCWRRPPTSGRWTPRPAPSTAAHRPSPGAAGPGLREHPAWTRTPPPAAAPTPHPASSQVAPWAHSPDPRASGPALAPMSRCCRHRRPPRPADPRPSGRESPCAPAHRPAWAAAPATPTASPWA